MAATSAKAAAASEKPAVRGIDEDIRGFLSFVESRADSRLERARRARFRLIVLGVLVALVGGATGLWALLTGGSGGSKATQTTVLLQVRDASENAIGSVVLVADKNAVAGKPTPAGAGRGDADPGRAVGAERRAGEPAVRRRDAAAPRRRARTRCRTCSAWTWTASGRSTS